MAVRGAGGIAAIVVTLSVAWAVIGCGPAEVGQRGSVSQTPTDFDTVNGQGLEFAEQTPIDASGWTITGSADRWVLVAADDGELSDLLAETSVWEGPEPEPEPPAAPAVPEGHTALLYYVGSRSHTAVEDSTVGVYESDGSWVVDVQRTDPGYGQDTISYEWHLVFVDAAPPDSVRLRFEESRQGTTEVTWW